tara:strand:+ start:47 stop:631 length:585 start_codon:yes stop_codon:yes gene_type:complete
MRILAISQRIDFIKNRLEYRDSLDQSLYKFFEKCGFLLLPIPNLQNKNLNQLLNQLQISGIVLSGGNDIGQYKDRDRTELKLIDYSIKNSIPLLGICRGMQMIAKWYGINLIQVKGHVNNRHKIIGEINTEVNSFHNFALSSVPNECELLAKSPDNTIEAIVCKSKKWEGWMWHPEREDLFNPIFIERIKVLFQ